MKVLDFPFWKLRNKFNFVRSTVASPDFEDFFELQKAFKPKASM